MGDPRLSLLELVPATLALLEARTDADMELLFIVDDDFLAMVERRLEVELALEEYGRFVN